MYHYREKNQVQSIYFDETKKRANPGPSFNLRPDRRSCNQLLTGVVFITRYSDCRIISMCYHALFYVGLYLFN